MSLSRSTTAMVRCPHCKASGLARTLPHDQSERGHATCRRCGGNRCIPLAEALAEQSQDTDR